jgi:hypothetical protein
MEEASLLRLVWLLAPSREIALTSTSPGEASIFAPHSRVQHRVTKGTRFVRDDLEHRAKDWVIFTSGVIDNRVAIKGESCIYWQGRPS